VVGNVGQAGSVPVVLAAFLGCLGLAGLIHALASRSAVAAATS
jgi:hypothetical protein